MLYIDIDVVAVLSQAFDIRRTSNHNTLKIKWSLDPWSIKAGNKHPHLKTINTGFDLFSHKALCSISYLPLGKV